MNAQRAVPWVAGLTGGIGSGKSLAADSFRSLGAMIVDTDLIAHQLTAPGGAAMPVLRETFGAGVMTARGALDRAAMRTLVFTDPDARHRLEAILHPLIRAQVAQSLAEAHGEVPYAILVVPLLFETAAYRQLVRCTLAIDCPVELQIQRVQQRAGLARGEIERIVAAQVPRALRLQMADLVVENTGSGDQLHEQIAALHNLFLAESVAT